MVAVLDRKLVFSRDQVITATQASKNFGDVRRRARVQPLFIDDRNKGIDTVIISFDEFETMAVELQELREERLRATAVERLARADSDANHRGIPFEDVMGNAEHDRLFEQEMLDPTPDSELFE